MLPTNQFTYQASPRIFGKNLIIPPDPPGDTSRVSDSFCRSSMLPPAARTHLDPSGKLDPKNLGEITSGLGGPLGKDIMFH